MPLSKKKPRSRAAYLFKLGNIFMPFPPASHPNADTPLLFCVRTGFLVVFLADDPACGMGVLDPEQPP
jgi:hypothetical protein